MHFYRYSEWSNGIRNYYWHLRMARGFDLAKIRKQYRRIAAEKNAFRMKALIPSCCGFYAVIWLTRVMKYRRKGFGKSFLKFCQSSRNFFDKFFVI